MSQTVAMKNGDSPTEMVQAVNLCGHVFVKTRNSIVTVYNHLLFQLVCMNNSSDYECTHGEIPPGRYH